MERPSPEADEMQTLEEIRQSYKDFEQIDVEGVMKRFMEGDDSDEV